MDAKLDFKAKPILTPIRSLDEGFESDPDRVSSTDTESAALTHSSLPSFDLYQRTDRDGVTHTRIARRHNNYNNKINTNISNNISNSDINRAESLIYLPVTKKEKEEKLIMSRANNENISTQQQQQQQPRRRQKTKAPPPPIHQNIPRSQSVDTLRTRDFELVGRNGDIMSGQFVRVTVDPRQQRLIGHPNNIYSFYPGYAMQQPHNYGLIVKSNKNQQMPICWTQSIPRQTRR